VAKRTHSHRGLDVYDDDRNLAGEATVQRILVRQEDPLPCGIVLPGVRLSLDFTALPRASVKLSLNNRRQIVKS
jgi:hypothetical protein